MLVIENQPQPKFQPIPAYLAYEEMNGEAIPYKGYKDVLAGNKQPEEIMGSSSLQATLVSILNAYIFWHINREKYLVATNESGLHLGLGDNLANDVAIFEKGKIRLDEKYFSLSPKVVIEVDIKVDLSDTSWNSEVAYIFAKSQKMLDFGVEKVIWISTRDRKIFVHTLDQDWHYTDFDQDIDVLDGYVLNVARLLAQENIQY